MDSKVLEPAFQEQAIKKLGDELRLAEDKSFAEPVIRVLIARCEGNIILSHAIIQENKIWEKCNEYLYFEAALLSQDGQKCIVDNDLVYQWAEDYYLKDDTEIEKVKKKAEAKHPGIKYKASGNGDNHKNAIAKTDVLKQKETQVPRSKKKNREMEGQLDLFSMM